MKTDFLSKLLHRRQERDKDLRDQQARHPLPEFELLDSFHPKTGLPLGDDEFPYYGLLAATDEGTQRFFGREAQVSEYVVHLETLPALLIRSESGGGKSSVATAGVPKLRKRHPDWLIAPRRAPGAHLSAALGEALATALEGASATDAVAATLAALGTRTPRPRAVTPSSTPGRLIRSMAIPTTVSRWRAHKGLVRKGSARPQSLFFNKKRSPRIQYGLSQKPAGQFAPSVHVCLRESPDLFIVNSWRRGWDGQQGALAANIGNICKKSQVADRPRQVITGRDE